MNFHGLLRHGALAAGLLLAAVIPESALAQADPRSYPDTGYTISNDAIWSFYTQFGGSNTFGEPISREFLLMGTPMQLFQNAALQVQPDGSVQPMQLTDPGLLPYTELNGLTVPAANPATAFVAPTPDQSNYIARLQVYIAAMVNEPFLSTYNATGGPAVWGLPASTAIADPNNPNFSYQRFQNGILFYDATAGTTQPLPLGTYLKDLLTGQNLPADLASEAANSPLLGQYAASQPDGLARPSQLTQTNLTDAFAPDVV
jgi:hypothetical protein